MKEAIILRKIAELNDAVTLSHVSRIAKAIGEEGLHMAEQPRKGASVEESLELLGLHLTYLLFDLEATQRENRYLRQMLETRPPRGPEEDQDPRPGV